MRTLQRLTTFFLIGFLGISATIISNSNLLSAQDNLSPIDIVWILDESSSMASDLDLVKSNINSFIDSLPQDQLVRFGILGFGAAEGHADTTSAGQAHMHFSLSNDINAFTNAVGETMNGGEGSSPQIAISNAMGADMGIDSENRVCAILVTDQSIVGRDLSEDQAAIDGLNVRKASLVVLLGNASFEEAKGTGTDISVGEEGTLNGYIPAAWLNMNFLREDAQSTLGQFYSHCTSSGTSTNPVEMPEATPVGGTDEMIALLFPTVQELSQKVEEHEARINAVENQLANLEPATNSAPEDASGLEGLIQKHEAEIEVLKQNFNSLADLLAGVTQLDQLNINISTNASSISANVASLAEVAAAMARNEQNASDLSSRITALESLPAVMNTAQDQLNLLSTTLADLDARVVASENNINNLPIDDFESRINSLEQVIGQVPRIDSDIDKNRVTLGTLETRVSEAEARLVRVPTEDHENRITSLENEVATLPLISNDVASLNTSVTQLQQRVAALDAGLRALPVQDNTGRIEALESSLTKLGDDERAQDQQVSDIEKDLRETNSKVSANTREISSLQQDHNSDIQNLSNRLTENESISNSVRSSSERNQNGIQELRILLETLTESFISVEAQANRLAGDFETLGLQIRDVDRKVDGVDAILRDRLEDLESELRILGGDIQQIQNLTRNLAENELTLSDLVQSQGLQDGTLGRLDQRLSRSEDRLESLNEIFLGLNDETRQSVLELLQEKFDQHDRDIQSLNTYLFILAGGLVGTILLLVMQIV
jgi:chromosome segregation ATPase